MADDDNFEIDIYGDDGEADGERVDTIDYTQDEDLDKELKDADTVDDAQLDGPSDVRPHTETLVDEPNDDIDLKLDTTPAPSDQKTSTQQQIVSTQGPAHNDSLLPKQAPIQQGVKRKEGHDDRATEPGASSAIVVSELNWWTSDDDIRGWANQCACEDELKDVTFSEHKVNGKSKGQAYIEFASPQAATAVKQKVESFNENQPASRKYVVTFTSPATNPYRTLPKDAPARQTNGHQSRGSSSSFTGGVSQSSYNNSNANANFRGRGRGGNVGMNSMTYNRGPTTPAMNTMPASGGYGNVPMGGFNNPMANVMGNMGGFNNFNRGGMMMGGMRGGGLPRGGFGGFNRGGGMMMGGMGGMPMNMGNNMGMSMGGMMPGAFGVNAQGHLNPAFFQAQQMAGQQMGGAIDQWNPHGAKRPRPE